MTTGTTFSDLLIGPGVSPYTLVIIAIASATFGMFCHWIKIHFKDKRRIRVFEYFFVHNLQATCIAFFTMLATLFAAFGPLDYTHVTVYEIFTQAFSLGYASDSIFNTTEVETVPLK